MKYCGFTVIFCATVFVFNLGLDKSLFVEINFLVTHFIVEFWVPGSSRTVLLTGSILPSQCVMHTVRLCPYPGEAVKVRGKCISLGVKPSTLYPYPYVQG